MKKNIFKISILLILFFIVNSSYVLAKERIIKEKIVDFNVEMNINTDSSIDITESFSINATENLKEYVVKRSFPVEYNGRKIEIKNIKVLEDSRDIIVKPVIKDRNIVTNLSDRELSVGIHTYNIKYKVKNLIEFEKDTCKINWHLCSDSFGVPINNYNIKINFPNGTQILKENIKVSDLTNDLKIEKNNISTKLDNRYVEISDNSLIYPGTDIILECEFKNDQITKVTFGDKIIKNLNRNIVSIIVLVLVRILFIFELYILKNKEIQIESSIKKLIALAVTIFIFIISIVIGMNINYDITANYMKNVFIKFIYLILFEGFIILMTYFIYRYEMCEKKILSKIVGICIIVSIVSIGLVFITNFLEDIYYNIFGYLVLLFVLISNLIYFIKLKAENNN